MPLLFLDSSETLHNRQRPYLRYAGAAFAMILCAISIMPNGTCVSTALAANAHAPHPSPKPSPVAVVLPVTVIPLSRAAQILRSLYPHDNIRADTSSNSIIVVGMPDDVQAMRTILQGVDVKNPTKPTLEVVPLHLLHPSAAASRLQRLFPGAKIVAASASSLLIKATPLDMTQIKALVASLDVAPPSTAPSSAPAEAIKVTQARPRDVAREVAHQLPRLRVSVAGSSVIVVGSADDITKAKALLATIDQPPFGARYTQVYRLHNIDATSVANLLSRSFPNVKVAVDKDLNALSVSATAGEQQRIGDSIAQLDAASTPTVAGAAPGSAGGTPAYGSSNIEVVSLKAPVPGLNQAASTSASDIATTVTQSLQQVAPDLHVTVQPNSTQVVLAGSPQSIRLAKDLINQLDVTPPLVVIDTEVLELDETIARNLGLSIPQAVLGTTFSEIQPVDANGSPSRLIRLQPLARTGLTLSAQINLLIQRGTARVLADPRITTLSGHTASIRAGDTIAILTSVGGGVGTPVTQQLQTFQTGVSLDITPMVSATGDITVSLHPVVNSLSGILNGVPQIATRDTQTVVHLADNQTLVIGGLIQEETQRSESKIPIVGDIPLIGRIFRNQTLNNTRNELIIVLTPHVLRAGETAPPPGPALPAIPTPAPLPTLPPNTMLPPPLASSPPTAAPLPTPITLPPPPLLSSLNSPAPSASPGATGKPTTTPTPQKTPVAFASANIFTYGQAPQNTYASSTDPAQIFYASFSPTVLKNGSPVSASVITTINVVRVTLGIDQGVLTSLSQIAPGKWLGNYNFSNVGLPSGQGTVQLTLTAYRSDNQSASIQIPISVTP